MHMYVQIMENSTVGTHVVTITALSRSALFYDISRGNEDLCFYINHHTGVINTRKVLDFEVCFAENVPVSPGMSANPKFEGGDF